MTLLVSLSDLHVGSKAAVCVSGFMLGHGANKAPYTPSLAQNWINDCFAHALRQVYSQSEPFILNLGGDLVDGDRHHNTRTTFGTPTEQANMAIELLEPYSLKAKSVIAVDGTEVHAGGEGEQDESVAQALGATTNSRRLIEIDGHLFDIAHHCTLPKDEHNWPVSLARQAYRIGTRRSNRNLRIPDMIIRGHVHRFAQGGATVRKTNIKMITLPAWQLRTPFMARHDPAEVYSVGMTVIDCKTLEVYPFIYEADDDPIERLA